MHIGYALIVAASLLRYGRGRFIRGLGALYPPFVLLVIVATGNFLPRRRRNRRPASRNSGTTTNDPTYLAATGSAQCASSASQDLDFRTPGRIAEDQRAPSSSP
jgi:hypothetical protein